MKYEYATTWLNVEWDEGDYEADELCPPEPKGDGWELIATTSARGTLSLETYQGTIYYSWRRARLPPIGSRWVSAASGRKVWTVVRAEHRGDASLGSVRVEGEPEEYGDIGLLIWWRDFGTC